MTSVAPPERSDVYTIRTAEGGDPLSDPKEYTPGELVTVYITVTKQLIQRKAAKRPMCFCPPGYRDVGGGKCDMTVYDGRTLNCLEPQMESAKYIGFLLYAVDSTERKVGVWEVRDIPPVSFWLPQDPGCGGISVMHADARPKRYIHAHKFRAPSAGAGPITFRALIKHGDTNEGAFYWPTAPAMGAVAARGRPSAMESGGDLVLAEKSSAVASAQSWFAATKAGESCDAVCAAHDRQVCDLSALQAAVGSPTEIAKQVAPFYTTMNPAVAGCTSAFPAMTLANGKNWLFFHADAVGANTCPSVDEITAPSCSAVPAGESESIFKMRRLCPCRHPPAQRRLGGGPAMAVKADSTVLTPCPRYVAPEARRRLKDHEAAHANAAAGRASISLSLSVLVGCVLALRNERLQPLLPLAALVASSALLPRAMAHNWMINPTTRASRASTAKPCQARKTNVPHVHVNPGQMFQMEWASGHGDGRRGSSGTRRSNSHYFTVVKAEDEGMLVFLTPKLLNEYIDAAPAGAEYQPVEKWNKRHLSYNTSQDGGSKSPSTTATRNGRATDNAFHEGEGKTLANPATDPNYMVRPNMFKCTHGRHPSSPTAGDDCYEMGHGLNQWIYPASALNEDERVAYASKTYPWIVSAHRFASVNHFPLEADVSRFKIDGEPGEYTVHWYWRGYSDCTDVAVLPRDVAAGTVVPEASESKYGAKGTTVLTFARIDHCLFGGASTRTLCRLSLFPAQYASRSHVCFPLAPLHSCAQEEICRSSLGTILRVKIGNKGTGNLWVRSRRGNAAPIRLFSIRLTDGFNRLDCRRRSTARASSFLPMGNSMR